MALIACPLADAQPAALIASSQRAQAAGADLIELRLDTALSNGGDPNALIAALPQLALPAIVTLRHRDEGGTWAGQAAQRAAWYAAADAAGAAYIDCELRHVAALGWRPQHARFMVSQHDFHGVPQAPEHIIAACFAAGADVAKLAYMPADAADVAIAHRLLRWEQRPLVVLAMGEYGLPSRLLAGCWGSHLTFARLDDDAGSAPGQPTVTELVQCYRLSAQSSRTRIYGVIGSPIAHSRSPTIHNPALAAAGLEAVYVPIRVEDVARFWHECGDWFAGISVTLPHKASIMRLLDHCDPLAQAIGAVNTVVRGADGTTTGSNTDAEAITASLRSAGIDVATAQVVVLGAGGAARAAIAACRAAGATVTVCNRTPERARAVAEEFAVAWTPWADAATLRWTVLINTTSVGLNAPEQTPWPHRFPAHAAVFDTVYVPERTRLIRDAEAAGCRVIIGNEMFVRQGAAQFAAWTGLVPPVAAMWSSLNLITGARSADAG